MRNNLSKLISRVSVWRRTRRSIHEEPGQGDEVDEKNDQIALGIPDDADQCSRAWRIAECVAGREILRNDQRNSNSPETPFCPCHFACSQVELTRLPSTRT